MSLIGLEINDAGIIGVDADGRRLPVETARTESPGFALVQGRQLKLGLAAQHSAQRWPRQINCRFWDALNDQPLRSPEFEGYTHAELAYRHLAQVWAQINAADNAVIFTVPDHYQDEALGLLLGITAALEIPVTGLISQALACLPPETTEGVYWHLDTQLHRLALTAVDCRSRPAVCRHDAIEDAGLEVIHRQWVKIMADAFVRQTRFDPLYAAEAEQELHDRLPLLVETSSANTPITVEMQAAGRTHRIQLEQEALMVPYPPWIEWLRENIKAWQQALAVAPGASHLLVTHRLAGLPGFVAQLENATGLSARKLPPGAAAAMSLAYADRFATGRTARGVPYLKRVTAPTAAAADRGTASATAVRRGPTHLLYQGWAYPITTQPLEVGREPREGSRGIRIRGRLAGISRRHFTVVRQDQDVLLTDTSSYGTRVDDVPVAGSTVLQVGQTLRIGSPGEILQAIACLPNDETTIP
ncbi:MAG: FHA domain-containing protein [Desulfobacterales bacterium]